MSETDFLKLKKHDNVETNTEKFDIENYLNGNWDKINENAKRVNTDISNINSKNTELEKELKEAQEDFYQNSIRGQASGEYIHVEDSSNCRAKIGISGNSEQEIRSEKNLLELMEGTYSNNGVTAVVKDGVITLNGTATDISFVGINLLKSFNLTTGTTYHLSAFNSKTIGDSSNICALRLNQEGTKQTQFNVVNSNLAIVGDFLLSYLTIRTPAGITYNNFVVKPQLELGVGTKEWEQGGVSPSPDYPSEIKAVGDNVNWFDKTTTTDGKYIGSDGSIQTENTAMCSDYIKIKSNENYYISGRTTWASIALYDKNKTFLERTATTSANAIFNTTNSNCKYIRLNALITDKDTLKFEKGSTVTPYSPHGQGSVKVTKCNENLYDEEYYDSKGYNSNTGILEINTNLYCNKNYIYIFKNGKRKVSLSKNGIGKNTRFFFYDIYKQYISTAVGEKNVDIPQNAVYLNFQISKDTVNNDMSNIKIEQNEITTRYVRHQKQSYIMPIQSEMLEGDYFDWDNEEEVHTWDKLILTGEETWYTNINSGWGQNKHVFAVPVSGIEDNGQTTNVGNVLKSNNFKCMNTGDLVWKTQDLISYYPAYKGGSIMINHQGVTKLTDFKTYLKSQYDAGTPVVVYYKLATPTKLAFTDEQKAVAKELSNARTYKNVTNITTDSIAILDLDYAKDLETLLNNTQALAISNASEGV